MGKEKQYNKIRLGKLAIAVILALGIRKLMLEWITMELSTFLEFILYAIIFTIIYGILFSFDFKKVFKKN